MTTRHQHTRHYTKREREREKSDERIFTKFIVWLVVLLGWWNDRDVNIFDWILIFENDSFVVPFVVAIRLPRMFDRDSTMFASDHRSPLRDIVDQVSIVDMHIEHLDVIPTPIVHFLECDSNDLYTRVRWLINTKPIDQHHVDSLLEHELLKETIDRSIIDRCYSTYCNHVCNIFWNVNDDYNIDKHHNIVPCLLMDCIRSILDEHLSLCWWQLSLNGNNHRHRYSVHDTRRNCLVDDRYCKQSVIEDRLSLRRAMIEKNESSIDWTYWCKVRWTIWFVDNHAYIDHISNQLHHLYMNIVRLFHYILFHVNQPDGNCILITEEGTIIDQCMIIEWEFSLFICLRAT